MERSSGLIAIPAFNEELTIENVVLSCLQHKNWDVLVVDDASFDQTEYLARQYPVSFIKNDSNQGYEKTLNIAYEFAVSNRYKYVCFIDADGEHDPSFVNQFSFNDDEFYLKIGVRTWFNRPSERFASIIGRVFYGIEDPYCGFKAYNLDALETLQMTNKPGDKVGTGLAREIVGQLGKNVIKNIKIGGIKRQGHSKFSVNSLYANIHLILNIIS